MKKIILSLLTIVSFLITVNTVYSDSYTAWRITGYSSPYCVYKNIPNQGRRGYLYQNIYYSRTRFHSKTGKTSTERKTVQKLLGQGGGSGCPMK